MNMLGEIGRRVIHLSWLFFVLVFLWLGKAKGFVFLSFFLCLSLLWDFLRIEFEFKMPFFHKLIRESEKKTLFTPTLTMIGTIIPLAIFDLRIAVYAICIMIFGDMAAGIIGLFGKIKFMKRTLEGSIACFIVSMFLGFYFLNNIFIIIGMSLAGTLVEAASFEVNDNLAIPIFSGFVGQILSYLFLLF